MKAKLDLAPRASCLALALLLLSTLNAQLSILFAQGTEFTYHGRLSENGVPFSGVVEMDATLWDAATNGNPIRIGHSVSVMVEVTNGLFTVALDFRKGAFPGEPRWLQFDLRTSPDPAPFTTLWPRQKITATPYAITAENVTGIVPSEGLFGGYGNALWFDNTNNYFAGRGYDLTDLNASELTSGTVPAEALGNAWKIGGNADTTPGTHFLGTTDNRALELRANGVRALLLQPHPFGLPTVSVIGGTTNNQIASTVVAATIGGGFNNSIQSDAHYATIGGGEGNSIHSNAAWATLVGGRLNTIQSNAQVATIGGGIQNTVRNDAQYAAIGGGFQNIIPANASFATIPGGRQNSATDYGFAAGRRANAAHTGSFVWADSQDAPFASTASNQFSVRAGGGARFVTGGAGMMLDGQPVLSGTVSVAQLGDGAVTSTKLLDGAALGELLDDDGAGSGLDADLLDGLTSAAFWQLGGNAGTTPGTHFLGTTDNQALELKVNGSRALRLEDNIDGSDGGAIPDGAPNLIAGSPGNSVTPGVVGATISGGGATNYGNVVRTNGILADYATIGGGLGNRVGIGSFAGTIAGGYGNDILGNSPSSAIGGGEDNNLVGDWSTIAGGQVNNIASDWSTIAGGQANTIGSNSRWSTIGGGGTNVIEPLATFGTIAGGNSNTIESLTGFAVIAGGNMNTIEGLAPATTIAGGNNNHIGLESSYSVIGGGNSNTIIASAGFPLAGYATIPGGNNNTATDYALAAGNRAKAIHQGSFVWADSTDADFPTTRNNQFLIRASGGVGIGTGTPANPLAVEGVGATNGGVIGFAEVTARFKRTGSGHTAVAVDSLPNQDAILYFAENSGAVWGLRKDADAGQQFQLRHHRGVSATSMLVVGTNGNVGIGTINPTNKLHVAGGVSATTFVTTSDRNAKENFAPVNTGQVLEKVIALPITHWSFKEDPGTPHMGPAAQDFYAAFRIGPGETGIATVDADGVALAAIQGLNEKVEVRSERAEGRIQKLEEQLKAKDTEIRQLRQSIAELKETFRNLTTKTQE